MTFARFDPLDPNETDVFTWDFTNVVNQVPGDALASVVGVAADSGDGLLTIGAPYSIGATVSSYLSTPTRGVAYAVRARITTVFGRTLDLTGTVYGAQL
jgi:hypothetical protein